MASDLKGWQPLKVQRAGKEAFTVTPFMRLARTHVASMAGNALVFLSLADSVFLTDPDESRTRVAMTLALTMVPFAVLSPIVGPWLDRIKGGRRWVIVGANALRIVVCLLLIRELETIYLYPLAFLVLMLDKSYNLAKSALLPTTVHSDDELVQANSSLTRLSGLAGVIAAAPAGLAALIAESTDSFERGQAMLALATVAFVIATIMGVQIPKTRVAAAPASKEERHELRSAGIVLAGSAMGLMRGILGFMTWLLAFWLQGNDATWQFGLVAGASVVGSLLGTVIAPLLRKAEMPEERIMVAALIVTVGIGAFCAYLGGLTSAVVLVVLVGITVSTAKLAFDSIVQKDAPEANRGRTFAKFETRFQLVWVAGSFLPVVVTIPLWAGFLVISGIAAFALVSYLTGLKAMAAGKPVKERNLARDLQRKLRKRSPEPVGAEPDEQSPSPSESRPPPPSQQADDTTVTIDPTQLH